MEEGDNFTKMIALEARQTPNMDERKPQDLPLGYSVIGARNFTVSLESRAPIQKGHRL